MSAPATVQACALSILRDMGVTSLNVASPPNQPTPLEPGDLDDVALALTQAIQEIAMESGGEQLRQPGSGWIFAPANVTLTATQGSNVISAFSGYTTAMNGCTIRISTDDQDNEILSATLLSKPFAGTSGSAISATVYCDCFTVDDTVERIIGPLLLDQNRQVYEVSSRIEYVQRCSFPIFNGYGGVFPSAAFAPYAYAPFWSLGNKASDQYPSVFFLDTYYNAAVGYPVRRVRLTPMPTVPQSVAWTNKMTPVRFTSADIVSGLGALAATGATSDTQINQTYDYLSDFAGFRMFEGVTHAKYSVFFHPTIGSCIACATLEAGDTPAAYWQSAIANSPIGTFNPLGTAMGVVTITTSDVGGGFSDPGTLVPMTNAFVEGVFLPVARKMATALPTFKNDKILPEIDRQYRKAIERIRGNDVSVIPQRTSYI